MARRSREQWIVWGKLCPPLLKLVGCVGRTLLSAAFEASLFGIGTVRCNPISAGVIPKPRAFTSGGEGSRVHRDGFVRQTRHRRRELTQNLNRESSRRLEIKRP
jgi:hypothetical protein